MPICKFCRKEFKPKGKTKSRQQEYCNKKCRNYYHQLNFLLKQRVPEKPLNLETDEKLDLNSIDR